MEFEEPPSDDGRMRFRYNFRRKSSPLAAPCPASSKSSCGAKQKDLMKGTPANCACPEELAGSTDSAGCDLVKQESLPPPAAAATSIDQPRTPSPAAEPVSGQMPRSHPSRVRISAVRNYPAGCRRNAANKDSPGAKRKREGEADLEEDEESVEDSGTGAARRKVGEALFQFESIYKKLLQDKELGSITDMQALKLFNEKNKEISGRKYAGNVPGIEVGDEFNLMVELCIVGLHCRHRLAIDFIHEDGKIIAVSLVYKRPYADGMDGREVFEYASSGDLKLEGNLALKNSMDTCTPVRVIHGFRGYRSNSSRETKSKKKVVTYIYDGLFLVEKYWRRKGSDGAYVCMFQFKRMPGQSELVVKGVLTPKNIKDISMDYDKHLIMKDISHGEEKIPIPVVNAIDDEHPKPFKYTTKMIYPPQHTPTPPTGCTCINGCSDSDSCACAVKNGGEIPFNEDSDIVEAKPLVYECGPSCKCPPSCHNRVSQHGIKFQLEIFKTKLRGWGVRSRDPIPSGSFICEYAGVLLDDQEADKRTNDEYLFDIGNNYYDEALWEGLKTSIPDLKTDASCEDRDVGFAVDALECGNVGRFVNHSCTPNLYAQNLLYDHDNKKMPHVVLFAAEDITPMQELTYDYNYAIDHVRDPDGTIKKKNCYCGTIECTGRMY